MKYRFKDYAEHYKRTLKLATPIMLAQVGYVTVQLVDNAMVGRLGKVHLSGVAFGGTVFFLVFVLVMGVAMGLTPLIGEQYSQGKFRTAGKYLQNSILLYFCVGLVASGILFSLIPLMYHMGQPLEVVDMAVPYFKYLALSVIPFTVFAAFKQFLEGVGKTSMNMIVIIVSNVINIFCNYTLIYGKWGFPALGVEGAGIGVLITRLSMPIMIISYFAYKDSLKRYFKFFRWSNFKAKWALLLLSIGVPISLQMFLEGSAFALTAIMMGWLGTSEIGGHQIANIVANFAFMVVIGVGAATTIRVSHEYGRHNFREIRKVASASYHIAFVWNAITATTFILLRNVIPRIFTSDPDVLAIASQLMILVAAFQFSDGLQLISVGVLRGIQDVKSIIVIALLSYIVINLPIGYFCAFILGWGAPGLWMGFIFGLSIAAVLLYRRYRMHLKKLRLGLGGVSPQSFE